MKDRLPFPLRVAAQATELDNIKILPVNEDTGVRHIVTTLNLPGWEKRLLKKTVKVINKDIRDSINGLDSVKRKKLTIFVYLLGGKFEKKFPLIYTELKYEIS